MPNHTPHRALQRSAHHATQRTSSDTAFATRVARAGLDCRGPAQQAAGVALLVVAALVATTAYAAGDEPTTTPYRPSVSTPAALSAPGWLEIEAGFEHDHAGAARRDSVPATFKLAFSPDWGVRVGGEAWVRQRDEAGRSSGVGDTSVVLKRRFAIDDKQAFGLEGGVTFATARQGLGNGSGKTDVGLNAIYSADFGDAWHTDLNLATTRLGQADAGASRSQWLWAASLSRALDERWGVVGEFAGTNQRGAGGTSQFLVAASCNVSKRLTLDAGAARSLRSGPATWSAFTGFTWLAAPLF